MSITSALSNAVTGLSATGRAAQVVSSNIANALTEGYGRREISVSSRPLGGGVQVNGVIRDTNPALVSTRRAADAAAGSATASAQYLQRLSDLLGEPTSTGSLTARVASFEAALVESASRPESTTRLTAVADAASQLAQTLNRAGDGVQSLRLEADQNIARDIALMTDSLTQVKALNGNIARLEAIGSDTNGLKDQRQQIIDSIADIVPLREIPRGNGVVALITTGGQVLLDSKVAEITFDQANAVAADVSISDGRLSGIAINGIDIALGSGRGRMDGGRLEAHFNLRDDEAPKTQAMLDAFATDLMERFEDPATDATRAVGTPGLFTDRGAELDTAATTGLAQRLTLNALVDADGANEVWRLRDGIGAATAGPIGSAATLQAMSDALGTSRTTPVSGQNLSAAQFASELISITAGAVYRAESIQTFNQTQADGLRTEELKGGVDTDQELQKLLLIEQSYAANARLIQTMDDLIRRLMEI